MTAKSKSSRERTSCGPSTSLKVKSFRVVTLATLASEPSAGSWTRPCFASSSRARDWLEASEMTAMVPPSGSSERLLCLFEKMARGSRWMPAPAVKS